MDTGKKKKKKKKIIFDNEYTKTSDCWCELEVKNNLENVLTNTTSHIKNEDEQQKY